MTTRWHLLAEVARSKEESLRIRDGLRTELKEPEETAAVEKLAEDVAGPALKTRWQRRWETEDEP